MRVTKHTLYADSIEFEFADGHTFVLKGGKPNALYINLEFLNQACLKKANTVVAIYSESSKPGLKLREGYDRESFLGYWDAAAKYFKQKGKSMLGSHKISDYNLQFLYGRCMECPKSVKDGRRTKVGPL